MDLDAFSAVHGATWARLDELSKARRRLTGAESDELVRLYQQVATHLSTIRSAAPDPAVVSRLSDILGRARAAITGPRAVTFADAGRFVLVMLPAALYRIRWWTVGVGVAFVAVAVAVATNMLRSPEAMALVGPPGARRAYAEDEFAQYYSEHPHGSFASMVWTNNALIAALCVVLGITGIGVLWLLLTNAVSLGGGAAQMAEQGYTDIFFQLILPHGLLELTCVFVAGAAGLKIFWTMIDPHGRPRGQALAEEGRALFTVALGLVGVLAVAGTIEGFVTPSSLPWGVKIAIGAVALGAFWAYVLILGRRAVRDGETGDVAAADREAVLPVAA